jgi:putative amino acid adenylation domain protein
VNNSIANLLKATCSKYKDKIAYKDSKSGVTFGDICTKSGSIATTLIKKGYYEKPILVVSERSTITPIAHIGIARSGNFYVPMDPSNPMFRMKQIINIIEANILLVDKNSFGIIESLDFQGEVYILEDLINKEYDEKLVSTIEDKMVSSMPLYVVFTSGSTGVPKGVTTSHESLMCYIDDVTDVLQLTDKDILANQSPMDYIAAVRDIFIPLKTGATTCIIPNNEFAIPDKLLNSLNNNKITTICWSSAGLELCVKTGLFECGIPKHLNKILFSGSILSGKALMEWQTALPNATFVNQYGPTEATASCTYYVVGEKANINTILPIGVPFKNYKIILLDDNDREVEQGCEGEICVSGPTVTLGYYRNPEATSKAYVQNPINPYYREIIYKTGDIGRYNSDGILEFCGRRDRQIKHMGHRIELEEIEAISRSIKGVDECAALYDYNKSILVLAYTGISTNKEIALHFRANFPAYMVPRRILKLDALPKLPNGKNDIKTLEREIIK